MGQDTDVAIEEPRPRGQRRAPRATAQLRLLLLQLLRLARGRHRHLLPPPARLLLAAAADAAVDEQDAGAHGGERQAHRQPVALQGGHTALGPARAPRPASPRGEERAPLPRGRSRPPGAARGPAKRGQSCSPSAAARRERGALGWDVRPGRFRPLAPSLPPSLTHHQGLHVALPGVASPQARAAGAASPPRLPMAGARGAGRGRAWLSGQRGRLSAAEIRDGIKTGPS